MAQWQRIHLPVQEMQIQFLIWEDPPGEGNANAANVLAWEILRAEEFDGLQSMRSQKVKHSLVTEQQQHQKIAYGITLTG